MKRILIIRHCHALGQHSDSPLSKRGNQQAYELSRKLERLSFPIHRIITSPFLRTKDSIKPFAIRQNITIETDDRLKERLLSEQPIDDWIDILEESFQNFYFKLPGGESSSDAYKRAEELLKECINDELNENIIIVTHGNLLALMLKKFNVEFGFHEWKTLTKPDVFLIERIGGEYISERIWEENQKQDLL
ncbi:phosphoglycerate mutase family 2 [Gracilibacillus boraciitolerans JCM 21714]|uniref:Phosphoglycerate mutase family 2 n=1 Tax=Gracilibacillus boraciitolerans JCM 21714 TaxID=1298598 RepID=W4VE46_9BACI|nr:histidine phosphatase family protein [Gracilibacillus boraciitolerans]GAE91431.1 phosphoglycerate mutase family 2 [Gracilibacillus boraciitolerans JCM 21714]